jgi:lysozyme family protein
VANFYDAIPIVLKNEGGYENDPDDPGGETNFGISKASYPLLDIRALTAEQATSIFLRDFWLFTGIAAQIVADKLFDVYVLAKHNAIKVAQQVAGVPVDGSYGPQTEAAINSMDPTFFLGKFKAGMASYYQEVVAHDPEEAKFLTGWLNRVNQ